MAAQWWRNATNTDYLRSQFSFQKKKTSGRAPTASYSCHSCVQRQLAQPDQDSNVQVQWIQKHGNLKNCLLRCNLAVQNVLYVNWRRWSSNQSKKSDLVHQTEGGQYDILWFFMVLHWIFVGGNMASNFIIFQKQVKKKTSSWCAYGYEKSLLCKWFECRGKSSTGYLLTGFLQPSKTWKIHWISLLICLSKRKITRWETLHVASWIPKFAYLWYGPPLL